MISTEQIDDWLKDHCRQTIHGLVWPWGTVHSSEVSRKIVRTYMALGLEPSETVSIDLVSSLVHRFEVLEHAVAEYDRRARLTTRMDMPDPNHWSSWTSDPGSSHSGAEGRAMAETVREAHGAVDAVRIALCPCVHPATNMLCSEEDRHIGGHVFNRSPEGVQP